MLPTNTTHVVVVFIVISMASILRTYAFNSHFSGMRARPITALQSRIKSYGQNHPYSMRPSPGIARNPFCLFSSADSTADLEAAIQAKGDEIRAEKAAGKTNADVADLVAELKSLKAQLEAASGGPKEPPAAPAEKKDKKKKEKKPPKAQQVEVDVAATLARVPFAEADAAGQRVGDYALIQSHPPTGRAYAELAGLGKEGGPQVGDAVWVRARVAAVRAKGGSCFLVLRQGAFETAQALHFKDKSDPEGSKLLIKFAGQIPLESIVDVKGTLAAAEVKSCSVSDVEIQIERLYVASRALPVLPFLLEDAARSEGEIEASQATERPFARVGQETRLDNRWLDLRVPANNAVMRVQSMVCQLFREALYAEGFCEIHSPKLIGGESEGGAGVFKTQYFDQVACLAQSPQLYKQMAISADLGRVFEIGPVFRAENSNTRRHLCEFTGLDLEMAITEHYNEVLVVMHRLFRHIFDGLEQRLPKELAAIREQYHSEPVTFTEEPCIIHWEEGIAMLRGAGVPDVGDFDDLNGAQELELGRLVKEKYGTDFFMLDRFPSAIRPFYTMPCPDDDRYSNSYDLFIRGQEICSGAQRVHDPDLLEAGIRRQGIDPAPLGPYLDAFRHGCSPHGGAGVGLERVVFLYLGLDNVRKASMFPRDPNRCSP